MLTVKCPQLTTETSQRNLLSRLRIVEKIAKIKSTRIKLIIQYWRTTRRVAGDSVRLHADHHGHLLDNGGPPFGSYRPPTHHHGSPAQYHGLEGDLPQLC